MKKLVFLSSLVLAATVVAAPVAFAQTDQPAPSCAEALAAMNEAQVAFDAAVKADEALAVAENAAAAALKKAADADAAILVEQKKANDADQRAAAQQKIADANDVANPTAANIAARDAARAEVTKALAARDAARAEVARLITVRDGARAELPGLDAAAAEARKAAETDAAELEADLATAQAAADDACRGPQGPVFVDLNCGDFPLPDGRTAQQVLDATPGQDPHRLDLDNDRVACEIDEPIDDGNDSDTGGDFDQVGELPTAIDTGRA